MSELMLLLSLSPSSQRGFELLNKNSGLCIKLQFGKTKLSGAIIILISKKKIKPLQIFPDYSALGDPFLPPQIFFIKPNCGNLPPTPPATCKPLMARPRRCILN